LETFEQDVAAVPVVHVHHVSLADLVDVHVVAEHLGQRLQRLLVDAEQRDEVEGVVDQHRLTRVADVHDVDVGGLLVVTSTA
jgi:glucose/arabinose dehydrogenase